MTGGGRNLRFTFGAIAVDLFNNGDFPIDLKEVFGPQGPIYLSADQLSRPVRYPSYTTVVRAAQAMIVVDPGDHARLMAASGSKEPEVDPPPVPLLEQLKGAGIKSTEVTHVVVTHLHFDHFAGLTRSDRGAIVPSFPNAEHIIPAKDWEMPDIAEGRAKKDEDLAQTLMVIHAAGLITFIDGRRELESGVAVEPCPGESPGHQLLAVGTASERGYIIGDLYHQKEEVEHPQLMATWTDREALKSSRDAFSARASRESAVVLPGHMPPGRISSAGGLTTWKEL